jgi:acyl-CoA synthetase (AMP-forming)/AMP-acid ligase II
MNLLSGFLDNAALWASRTAIVEGGGRRISYGALADRSAELAGAWRAAGVGPGDRVLIAMPIGVGLYAAIAALWRIGATIVFPEPALGLAGLVHAAKVTQPRAILTSGLYRLLPFAARALFRIPLRLRLAGGRAEAVVHPAEPDHPALISFTSGSTGAPKAILRTHGFLAAQNACVADLLRTDTETRDLVAFPVFVIANLGLGVTSVLPNWKLTRHDRADPRAILALIEREGVTRALAPPSICAKLAQLDALPLEAIFTGGGPVFPDLVERLQALAPGAKIVSVYGSTEAEPIAHQIWGETSADDRAAMRAGAGLLAGKPIAATRVRLIDEEIVVTGAHVNKTYLYGSDASAKLTFDGEIWHRTGDAGRFDSAGRLWLLGRRDACVAGFHPLAVEAAARLWPGVRAVALAALDDRAILAIEGDAARADDWRARAAALGDLDVRVVARIPLDRRHRSKVDYVALRRALGG